MVSSVKKVSHSRNSCVQGKKVSQTPKFPRRAAPIWAPLVSLDLFLLEQPAEKSVLNMAPRRHGCLVHYCGASTMVYASGA